MNVNLDGPTCMQHLEVTTQVGNALIWVIFKMDLNLNSYSNKVYMLETRWGYCRCIVAATVTLGVLESTPLKKS
jgi:hypothetical protein